MKLKTSKLLSLSEAIAQFVPDGSNVITGSGYNFRRAVEDGSIEVEDHSNLTLALRAGAMGVIFILIVLVFPYGIVGTWQRRESSGDATYGSTPGCAQSQPGPHRAHQINQPKQNKHGTAEAQQGEDDQPAEKIKRAITVASKKRRSLWRTAYRK